MRETKRKRFGDKRKEKKKKRLHFILDFKIGFLFFSRNTHLKNLKILLKQDCRDVHAPTLIFKVILGLPTDYLQRNLLF